MLGNPPNCEEGIMWLCRLDWPNSAVQSANFVGCSMLGSTCLNSMDSGSPLKLHALKPSQLSNYMRWHPQLPLDDLAAHHAKLRYGAHRNWSHVMQDASKPFHPVWYSNLKEGLWSRNQVEKDLVADLLDAVSFLPHF